MATRKLCTFVLDGQLCGVEVERVQEVLGQQEMTRVPLAPPAVRGLIALRGHIVPAIDLRRRLGLGEAPAELPLTNVVVRSGHEAVSLLVDEAGEVLDVEDGTFEEPPEALQGAPREVIRGAYKLDDRLLLLLDVDRAVSVTGGPTA